ncbi:hypothetical protein TFLX_01755 [Thermoflexales bacterium]|nr:hypothetical protein TFLX_01755 [Thermoflexales bacterium]
MINRTGGQPICDTIGRCYAGRVSQVRMITRRQFLKWGAGLSALLLPAGCRMWLERIGQGGPTPTSTQLPTLTPPSATSDSLPPTAEVITQRELPGPPVSPIETPQAAARSRPTWIAPAGGSKIGFHVVFGSRAGLDECLWWCALSGHPVPVIKCVDDFEAAFKAKSYSDQTLTVGRVNGVGLNNHDFVDMQAWEPPEYQRAIGTSYTTVQEAAQQYYDLVKPIWQLNPVIDVWETFNEFSWHWPWQADFYIALMDLAEADGYRLGLWSPSVGNPPEEFYPEIARACRRAKTHGNHILCLHEYGLEGLLKEAPANLVTRYRQLYQYLQQEDAIIPLVISEAGEYGGGSFTNVETFMDDFTWYDAELSRDSYVIGCAAWTLGDWNGANFQAALPALTEYIAGRPITARTYLPLIAHDQVE